MEVEELNGYIVRQAEEMELQAPYNRAIVRVGRLVNDHVIRPYSSTSPFSKNTLRRSWQLSNNDLPGLVTHIGRPAPFQLRSSP